MDIFERGHMGYEHKHVEQLYRFTDRLRRGETPNNVYEAALDTITCALGCSRAAILLLDDTGLMRFASERGLSDPYQGGVEGHSPWTPDVKDPQPICIQDVEAAGLPETLKKALRAEQIKALAFIPLVADRVLVGMLVTYYDACHVFSKTDIAFAVIIARQLESNLQRKRVEEGLRRTQRQVEAELAATQHLQNISTQLIRASDVETLYEKILDAAVTIMGSDFASMQMFHPERGELQLLAHRGFDASSVAFWQWVRPGAGCICGAALSSGERAIVSDVECCDFMAGTENLREYREAGMRAMQSTPLVSRTGRLLGMISTHWRNQHQPSERELQFLDVLARQAADLIERKRAEQHQLALNAELSHRVKNVLATVCSIIDQTRHGSTTFGEFVVGVDRRIRSLANTHDLLSRAHWQGVALAEIVQREFAPYGRSNSEVSGPSVLLKAEAAQGVAMVLHELTTNAAKYGAFSKRSGRVLLKWWWQQNGGDPHLIIEWKEVGGPPVVPPSRSGYGTSVVRELIPFELGGSVDLVFATDGLECRLELSSHWVSTASSPKGPELVAASTGPST
jgi:two-component sensor histidine kinase